MSKIKNINLLKEKLKIMLADPNVYMKAHKLSREEYEKELENIQAEIEKSKKGKRSKVKGSNYERKIAKIFKEKLNVDLVRTPLSGGFMKRAEEHSLKGDLTCLERDKQFILHVECKDHKTWKLKEWINQAEEDCPKDKIPIIVFHKHQEIENGKRVEKADDYVCLKLDDFLKIVDKNKIIRRK